MKQILALLALAAFVVGCNTTHEDMGSTSSDSQVISGSVTNDTHRSTINTNLDANPELDTSKPSNDELGNLPNSTR
jgi:hypothetical protein